MDKTTQSLAFLNRELSISEYTGVSDSTSVDRPPDLLLSIAIPTYNRAEYLELCLSTLLPQAALAGTDVEVRISDNASADGTREVVESFVRRGFSFHYHRHAENIGSDRNIAHCFNEARGKYVLILGDDDVLIDGSLATIIAVLRSGNYGGVFIRAYGYDSDFSREKPFQFAARPKSYVDANAYVRRIALQTTFISSLVINKRLLQSVDANRYVGTSLVQSYLFFSAVFSSGENVIFNRYLVAAKRNNSGGYNFLDVFFHSFNTMMRTFIGRGLDPKAIRSINRKLLWRYFPDRLLRLRRSRSDVAEISDVYASLLALYRQEPLFWICAAPVLKLPRGLAMLWGYCVVAASRLVNGEIARLFAFAWNRAVSLRWLHFT